MHERRKRSGKRRRDEETWIMEEEEEEEEKRRRKTVSVAFNYSLLTWSPLIQIILYLTCIANHSWMDTLNWELTLVL